MAKTYSYDELEAFFLNHDDPYFELIAEGDSFEEAYRLAKGVLKDEGVMYEDGDLKQFINKVQTEPGY